MPVPELRPGRGGGADRLHPFRHVGTPRVCRATTAVRVERRAAASWARCGQRSSTATAVGNEPRNPFHTSGNAHRASEINRRRYRLPSITAVAAADTRPTQRQLRRLDRPQRVQVEHLPGPGQHIGVDHIALVLAADRPPQPGRMPGPEQRQIAAGVSQRHRQPQPGHRRRLRHRHHPRRLGQPAGQRPQPGQRRRHPEPVRPDPTIGVGDPHAHFMLRDDRSIDPDPHQPRRVTTTREQARGFSLRIDEEHARHRPVNNGRAHQHGRALEPRPTEASRPAASRPRPAGAVAHSRACG